MVTYTYSITPEGPGTLQDIFNNITQELSTGPTITQDIEIILDKGNYSGATLRGGSLFPLLGTAYRLVIRSGGDYFPIIDFNYSNEEQLVGLDIGSGNSNVTVKGIRVQYFPVGIRVGLNSHYPIIKNCIASNNRNVGVFFEQCTEAQALQNIVINGDYGIVCRLTKSAAVIHNTIFQNGAISTDVGKSISCIWAELANDYGGGLTDKGTLHLLGNVGWNTSGKCLTLFSSDLEVPGCLVSNFNDWVVGDPDNFIAVEDNAFYLGTDASPRVTYKSLSDWKALGYDASSISRDPKFISAVKIKKAKNTGFSIDLNVLPVSPVLGVVPSFAFNSAAATTWLPSYVDSAQFTSDILKKPRAQNGTAIGANDKPSTSGYFGQDVFSDPLDLDIAKSCGVDPFADVLFKSLELWYPKIKTGYFYSREREYYLYSKKKTAYIGELARTKFFLPGKIALNKDIKVTVSGKEVTSDYYDIVNDEFILYHKDLNVITGEEEVELAASISTWKGDQFIYNEVLYRFKVNEGETRYYLTEDYNSSGPVVVTDDWSYTTDSDYISNREYSVYFDKQEQKSEIEFANHSNRLLNSEFSYKLVDSPMYWEFSGATVVTPSLPYLSVAGPYVCSITGGGSISKTVVSSTGESYSFSFHARSPGSGDLTYSVEYFDSFYNTLGVVQTGSVSLTESWKRYSILFNSSGENYDLYVPSVPYPCINLTGLYTPSNTYRMNISIGHTESTSYLGPMYIDAVQYEKSTVPSLYHRKVLLNEMTVEYESSDDAYFIDRNLSIAPATNLISDGFIYIPEIPAVAYGGPNIPSTTTLHEWKWPEGRKFVMPWARTKGKDKLRKRVKGLFNIVPDKKPEIVAAVNGYASASDIFLIPKYVSTFVGDTNGVGLCIKVLDTDSNPHAMMPIKVSIIDNNLRYPGLLSKRKYGLKQQLSTLITDRTDNAGTVSLTWIPPTKDAGITITDTPSPTLSSINNDVLSFIKTEYPVNLEGFGNILILDVSGNTLPIHGNPVKEVYTPTYTASTSKVLLKYPIKRGSVKVTANNKEYKEAPINLLDDDQFFIDYENSIIVIPGRLDRVTVEYIPSYVYVGSADPYKIIVYHNKVFGSYSNKITVGYNFSVKLEVVVEDPINSSTLSKSFELVAQHPLNQRPGNINTLSLEI